MVFQCCVIVSNAENLSGNTSHQVKFSQLIFYLGLAGWRAGPAAWASQLERIRSSLELAWAARLAGIGSGRRFKPTVFVYITVLIGYKYH